MAKRKAGCPRLGWEDVIKKDLKEMGTSWEGVKRETLNRLGLRRSLRSCVSLRQLRATVELLLVARPKAALKKKNRHI